MSGNLPDGWQNVELSALCKQHSRRAQAGQMPIFSVSKDYGLIAQNELFKKRIASEDTSNYKTLRNGEYAYDPMLLWTGSIGELRDVDEAMISPAYITFSICGDVVDRRYFNAMIKLPRMIERFRSISHGTNVRRKKASFDDFAGLVVSLPSLEEQFAIAEVLRSVEINLDESRKLLKSLTSSKTAVMRELLTRGMRRAAAPLQPLPERWVLGRIAGDVGQIPTDWKLVRLTSVAKLESGHTPDRKEPDYWDGDIPWISLQDADALGKLTISETAETIGEQGLANSSARLLPARTVVFQRTANVGLCSIMEREMCTSQHFANWVCGPKLSPEYLQQVFRHMQREWQRLVAGSVLPDIYMPTFKRLQILLPPLAEQEKIAEIGASFDRRIEAEQRNMDELANVRAALAQELLSGRLRLPASMVARFAHGPAALETFGA